MNFNELLTKISFDTFAEIIAISPRKVRESLFSHYGIKSKTRGLLTSIKEKKEQRIKILHETLQAAKRPRELEFLKELFRNWLFSQRPLLKATLDYLKVENDNGLVEEETDFFEKLSEQQVKELISFLKPSFSHDSILIYLSFMQVPFLDKHL